MRYAVIIPSTLALFTKKNRYFPCIDYFTKQGVPVFLALNGCDYEEARDFAFACKDVLHLIVLHGGAEPNPYKARNFALKILFSSNPSFDAAILIDADTEIDEDYVRHASKLLPLMGTEVIGSGRVCTMVPDLPSLHFRWLKQDGFECYDGFTQPGMAIGANMIIGRKVYEKLGAMRSDQISGGDTDYCVRWKKLGGEVRTLPQLIVHKVIEGMTYAGICEKQLRRAQMMNKELLPSDKEIIDKLREALEEQQLALADHTHIDDMGDHYSMLVDATFRTMFYSGMLARRVDAQ